MEETPVVTCFLRHGPRILLLRRSDEVGSYRGRWGAVAGHVAPAEGEPGAADPDAAARREIAEETGLADAVTLVRRGDPFAVADHERGTRWRVHPYLFDCERRAATTNYETAAAEWVHATEIPRRDTVPDLWGSYDAVRPSVATVRDDETHGSAYLSLRAVEVLRDAAGAAAAGRSAPDLAGTARELRDARPAMTALRVRVDRAMATADGRAPDAIEASARSVLDGAADADGRAARAAAERIGGTVATCSRSGTVRAAIDAATVDRVLVPESRPGREGVGVAEGLADDVAVTLTSDAAAPRLVDRADAVLVGADAVAPDGAVVNKVGTYPLALAADRAGVPVLAVCARDKIAPGADRSASAPPFYDGDADLDVENPLFEATPGDLATVVTEDGALTGDEVRAVAAEHAALADWDREAQ